MQGLEIRKNSKLNRDIKVIISSEIESFFTYWLIKNLDWFGWSRLGRILRPKILRTLGFSIGKNVKFASGIVFNRNKNNISLGDNTRINSNVYFDPAGAYIKIGEYCDIGFNTVFACGNHKLKSDLRGHREDATCRPIIIENFVWIGCNVVVLGGVTVGEGSVVAAGSVVTDDVPPNVLVAGVPARQIKTLE